MTDCIKLWMEENDIEIGEWFKLKYGSASPMHITDEYTLLDVYWNSCSYTLSQLLAGNYTIVKLKIKLTKGQWRFTGVVA